MRQDGRRRPPAPGGCRRGHADDHARARAPQAAACPVRPAADAGLLGNHAGLPAGLPSLPGQRPGRAAARRAEPRRGPAPDRPGRRVRPALPDLVGYATRLGVPVALSPSVTPLAGDLLDDIAASGVKAVSVSLDGASAATHDALRGVPGHFDATLATLRDLAAAGVAVQVNTTVMRANAAELADIAAIVARAGCRVWEVFFLVHVGRGTATGAISPAEHEEVCHFLYDASGYRLTVRAVEAPFFRR